MTGGPQIADEFVAVQDMPAADVGRDRPAVPAATEQSGETPAEGGRSEKDVTSNSATAKLINSIAQDKCGSASPLSLPPFSLSPPASRLTLPLTPQTLQQTSLTPL